MQEESELDWDALYADQAPRVYNYFRFRLAGADVEDLTSRTFERAWRARARYRRDLAGFSTWLFKIAHNVALDHLQAQRSHLPIDAYPNKVVKSFVGAGYNAPQVSAEPAALPSATAHEQVCDNVRDDGVYEVLPETPVRFEQQLQMLPTVLAVVPYAAVQLGALAVSPIGGVEPSQRSIQDGSYPGSRTMYLYVNANQARRLTTMHEFLLYFLKPLDNDFRTGIDMSLRRPERLQILENTFNALGYSPVPGEQR
ncbi:MAG TPA: sigma factor [Steroidobacteraceae bacterium]|nr:sigma factor [Steroidobacteraceae bacterium]